MKPRDAALYLAVAKVLGEQLGNTKTTLSSAAELAAGDRLTAKLPGPDGPKVATVIRVRGGTTAKVVDERGLLAWCKKNHPTEVQTVERIRPAFLSKLMDAAVTTGEGVDPASGDPLKYIEVKPKADYTRVDLEDDAADRIQEAWKSGALDLRKVLELHAGGDEA